MGRTRARGTRTRRARTRVMGQLLTILFVLATLGALASPGGGFAAAAVDTEAPSIIVDPGARDVVGLDWPAHTTVTVTVGDPTAPDFSEEWPTDPYGFFHAGWIDHELVVGDVVTATDGTTTRAHEILDLTMGIVAGTAQVTGSTTPGAEVTVFRVHRIGTRLVFMDPQVVTADGDGLWSYDASDWVRSTVGSVWALVFDDEGNATGSSGPLLSHPAIQVTPATGRLVGYQFAGASLLRVTVDDDGTTRFASEVPSDEDGRLDTVIDLPLRAGHRITVTDRELTFWTPATHVVLPLTIERIDVTTETVSGHALPHGTVEVTALTSTRAWLSNNAVRFAEVAADGTWTADFAEQTQQDPDSPPFSDLRADMVIEARQEGPDGGSTLVERTAQASDTPIVGVCPAPRIAPVFGDVSPDSVHVDAIDCAAYHEIALGYADDTYRPATSVRRDQMASFIVRTLEAAGHTLPAPAHPFTDIAGSTHERAIGQLAAADIVLGRSPTEYAPARTVTRDQMASYLVRALDWARDTTHSGPESPFTDVAGNTHEQAIHTAYDLGLTTGRTDTTYEPRTDVRRDQMATFLVRLLPQAMHTA